MALSYGNGYWLCDDFDRLYELVRSRIPFVYTTRQIQQHGFKRFDAKELGDDKWRLKKWFLRCDVRFLDPANCFNSETHRLLPVADYWASMQELFAKERFSRIKDGLKTAICTLTDWGYVTADEMAAKLKEMREHRGIEYYARRKGQSTLPGAIFGGKGREEEYGNGPFQDFAAGLVHKTKGERFVFEKCPDSGHGRGQRVSGGGSGVQGWRPEVHPPCSGS